MFKYIISVYLLILNTPKIAHISEGTQENMPSIVYSNPKVPFEAVIPGGLYPGKTIHIQGLVSPRANRLIFDLSLRGGVAFHYNPRFDENRVVRNSLTGDGWGIEEDSEPMPFYRGQQFQVIITCKRLFFNVNVNGGDAHRYYYRITDLKTIDFLSIFGDLKLTSVSVEN